MIEYIIIAILQGLFEWLPISSSGQTMIISMNIFGISADEAFSLSIWLHLGTTLAVLLKFKTDYIKIIKSIIPRTFIIDEIDIRKRNWLIYATIGTAITALPLYFIFRFIISGAFTPFQGDLITLLVCGLLIITGIILLKSRKIYGENSIEKVPEKFIRKDSFVSGLIQGFSILPGISRSGVTVSSILIENYDQDNALRLSFLMSAPVVIASIIVDIIFGGNSIFRVISPVIIVITVLISFIIGYLSIEFLLKIAQKISFGYFCILYGVIACLIIIPFMIIS
ncbi:MAG: undecaprenyl-diphosphate phosphatase [Promethearchaeota archaeon]